ncbi:MAG: ribosome recycling factor [Mangrovibacterium sp.]
MEEVGFILDVCNEKMEGTLAHLETELTHIRAGKASPQMIAGVMVDYYGSMTPLTQVANVTAPDARTIAIQPWEKQMIPELEKAIINSNLGFNPENNGEIVRITVPILTEERRKGLSKQANAEGENAKVSIRNARKDANDSLKKLLKEGLSEDSQKDAEAEVQTLTNNYSKKVEEMLAQKNEDIFKI